MKFDFTPDPKVLIALTHTPMQPLDALCELIDNAIDSFYSAKIQGIPIDNPMVFVTLPTKKEISLNTGFLRIQDNGPGMTAENAEKAIKAGFSGNNPYDTLGLFGMGFNISTGKLGNVTTFMTSRKDMPFYVKTVINLEQINERKNYSLDAEEILKDSDEFFTENHGTVIEVRDWWPEGNSNHGYVQKLIQYGMPKIREEIGRRYATILRKNEIKIFINDVKCEAYEHCVWADTRFVTRKSGKIPAVIRFDEVVGNSKRCGKCTAVIPNDQSRCPSCGSTSIRTLEERVNGWIGIQRFDSETEYGIDLIRNGRAIRVGEKSAFFEYVDDLKHTIKDYPIDQIYGRIVGEINLDFVPVDFLKQDFQRSSAEWQKAMEFIRGNSSLQPNQKGASENKSPLFKLFQGYRRVRHVGVGDMYMGIYDTGSRSAKRVSRDVEKEYYQKFKAKEPGYYDDAEWWKLVESADQAPIEELPECRYCGCQNPKDSEVCAGCGEVLIGKTCLNEECGQFIPASAVICPSCGANQVPVVIEPWICKICGTKNVATDSSCKKCGGKRDALHPLSREELLANSDKVDELSVNGLSITLADGTKNNGVTAEVYATHKPMIPPMSKETAPLIIHKDLGKLYIFVDLAHPLFTKCNLSKEQIIASEIAMYIYQEKGALTNHQEFNLSNLTWEILRKNWRNEVEIDYDLIAKDAAELLQDIMERLLDNLGEAAAYYFEELTTEEQELLLKSLIKNGIDLSEIKTLKDSGEYLRYAPFTCLRTIYKDDPDLFFGGKVWTTTLANGGEEIFGQNIIKKAKEKIISQYGNYLQDVILFCDNKYNDILTLKRVKLSIEFLRKGLAV